MKHPSTDIEQYLQQLNLELAPANLQLSYPKTVIVLKPDQ